MIEAVIYGDIPRANNENDDKLPPPSTFIRVNKSLPWKVIELESTPGTTIVQPILYIKIITSVNKMRPLSSLFLRQRQVCEAS